MKILKNKIVIEYEKIIKEVEWFLEWQYCPTTGVRTNLVAFGGRSLKIQRVKLKRKRVLKSVYNNYVNLILMYYFTSNQAKLSTFRTNFDIKYFGFFIGRVKTSQPIKKALKFQMTLKKVTKKILPLSFTMCVFNICIFKIIFWSEETQKHEIEKNINIVPHFLNILTEL